MLHFSNKQAGIQAAPGRKAGIGPALMPVFKVFIQIRGLQCFHAVTCAPQGHFVTSFVRIAHATGRILYYIQGTLRHPALRVLKSAICHLPSAICHLKSAI